MLLSSLRYENGLSHANTAFTVLFTIEMVLKMFALGIPEYFTSTLWNVFDFGVVGLSLVELGVQTGGNVGSLRWVGQSV